MHLILELNLSRTWRNPYLTVLYNNHLPAGLLQCEARVKMKLDAATTKYKLEQSSVLLLGRGRGRRAAAACCQSCQHEKASTRSDQACVAS